MLPTFLMHDKVAKAKLCQELMAGKARDIILLMCKLLVRAEPVCCCVSV